MRPLSANEVEQKLGLIARLTLGEIEGWREALAEKLRPEFPGERAALMARERELRNGGKKAASGIR